MGSEYVLYEQGEEALIIHEMSNKLTIETANYSISPQAPDDGSIIDLTPEEMMTIMIKGLEVCSYWMDEDEFKKQLRTQLKEKMLL